MLGFGLGEGKAGCRMGRRRGSCSRGGGPERDRVRTRLATNEASNLFPIISFFQS
jgi:hypothetical protein